MFEWEWSVGQSGVWLQGLGRHNYERNGLVPFHCVALNAFQWVPGFAAATCLHPPRFCVLDLRLKQHFLCADVQPGRFFSATTLCLIPEILNTHIQHARLLCKRCNIETAVRVCPIVDLVTLRDTLQYLSYNEAFHNEESCSYQRILFAYIFAIMATTGRSPGGNFPL